MGHRGLRTAAGALCLAMLWVGSTASDAYANRTARATYQRATAACDDGELDTCIDLLRETHEQLGRRVVRVQSALIRALFRAKRWEEAVTELGEYRSLPYLPNGLDHRELMELQSRAEREVRALLRSEAELRESAETAYRRALSSKEPTDADSAEEAYGRYLEKFPRRAASDEARERKDEMEGLARRWRWERAEARAYRSCRSEADEFDDDVGEYEFEEAEQACRSYLYEFDDAPRAGEVRALRTEMKERLTAHLDWERRQRIAYLLERADEEDGDAASDRFVGVLWISLGVVAVGGAAFFLFYQPIPEDHSWANYVLAGGLAGASVYPFLQPGDHFRDAGWASDRADEYREEAEELKLGFGLMPVRGGAVASLSLTRF